MKLALIDADILVYESAYRSQSAVEWDPGEWTNHASMPEAQADFESCIEHILKNTGAERAILALTDHNRAENFRRNIWPGYKAHREQVGKSRPLLYSALREWIRETFDVRQKPGIEADDTIGILATGKINGLPPTEERVICSVDKDLDTVPGWHFNWRKQDQGVRGIGPHEAFYYHMYQTLIGDTSDGYPGLPGCGPKTATKILDEVGIYDVFGMWQAVVLAYQKKGLTSGDALQMARCARILQAEDWDFETNTVRLWTPPEGDN